jgi:hypothetical protein
MEFTRELWLSSQFFGLHQEVLGINQTSFPYTPPHTDIVP